MCVFVSVIACNLKVRDRINVLIWRVAACLPLCVLMKIWFVSEVTTDYAPRQPSDGMSSPPQAH